MTSHEPRAADGPGGAAEPAVPGTPAPPPELRPLRDEIDAIDHEIVDALARRNEVVARVAAVKAAAGYPIRDAARERALLADRTERAADGDVRPAVIESLFRVILWASRDRQAALGAETPADLPQHHVAIIGGGGGIGRLFGELFTSLGQRVSIVDRDTALRPAEAAAAADVTLVAVPIDVTPEVIAEVGPHVRPGGLFMDVTSVKQGPVAAMLASSRADVIGTHPLFGPSVHSLQGQRVAVCAARVADDSPWPAWLHGILRARGLEVIETDAAHHDRVMSAVQVLVHHATEVLGRTLASLDLPLEETLRFTSPVYLMELMMAARHFAQSADLYRAIQAGNPETPRVMAAFRDSADALAGAVASDDHRAFEADFERVRSYFGSFSAHALDVSSFLVDRLVERGTG